MLLSAHYNRCRHCCRWRLMLLACTLLLLLFICVVHTHHTRTTFLQCINEIFVEFIERNLFPSLFLLIPRAIFSKMFCIFSLAHFVYFAVSYNCIAWSWHRNESKYYKPINNNSTILYVHANLYASVNLHLCCCKLIRFVKKHSKDRVWWNILWHINHSEYFFSAQFCHKLAKNRCPKKEGRHFDYYLENNPNSENWWRQKRDLTFVTVFIHPVI